MTLLTLHAFQPISENISLVIPVTILAAVFTRILYYQYLHPLSKFPGPWYATSFSAFLAVVSLLKKEPEFLIYLTNKYGHNNRPIRISPTILLFPRATALKEIYWDPKCNTKSNLYGSGALGPPSLFSILDGEEHKQLRRALSNAPWTIGQLKNTWENRFDERVSLFIKKMNEHAVEGRLVCISDKVGEFAADIMSMISFTDPLGCVENQRDEKDILKNWRHGLSYLGFATRFRFFRERIMKLPVIGLWLLPSISNDSGMGWLMCEANRQVTQREEKMEANEFVDQPDFLQHCLDARFADGTSLNAAQKRAHVTLLIQAGADTTATSLGSILRFLVQNPSALESARSEIDAAEKAGYLSVPIQYEETRQHLPYFVACIKEGLRLNPPATNMFARVAPKGGMVIDGEYVPEGTDITTYAYVVQRDKHLYGEDAEQFNPQRWLKSNEESAKFEASQFTFGMGPRVCIGKDIAIMEMYKLLPEIIRRFELELVDPGKYVVSGGVAYNVNFLGRFIARNV